MVESIAFKTRARTIDHLGREQIADCPTAISELWKNSYDAYARNVELRLFDGEIPVAAILDNGHGMNHQEFVDKWLVVGTESKFQSEETSKEDRNGLAKRPRQGQKGIGRLSAANLGPLLLLVSKRSKDKFIVALLDWRIFENPYLVLSDIKIPVAEFEKKEELFPLLPDLFELLTENVLGQVRGKQSNDVKDRNGRIALAWKMYDETIASNQPSKENAAEVPSELILNTLIGTTFSHEHIENWGVWKNRSQAGTALLIADIDYDLKVHLRKDQSPTVVEAKQRFVETLSSFVDPFFDPNSFDVNGIDIEFEYAVYAHYSETIEPVVSKSKDFNRSSTTDMEHVIDGFVDNKGVFHGKVKAFSEWVDISNECIIDPPKDLNIPSRANTKVGAFDIYISTFEQERPNTTHSDLEFQKFQNFAKYHSGFLVFRNGLRVLPYGRTDNDFFQIEMRRSKQAGREFWNARRMFGRVGLTSIENPNLKDKAGREGFIDNVAAKTLKLLVENILKKSARDYFGYDSEIRKDRLPEVQAANREQRAKEARNKLRSKNRKLFRGRLRKYIAKLPNFLLVLESISSEKVDSIDQVIGLQEKLSDVRDQLSDYRLPGAPKPLGSLENDYAVYLGCMRECNELVAKTSLLIDSALERINPAKPIEILEKQRQRYAGKLHSKIKRWKAAISKLQQHESERVAELVSERNKLFHSESESIFLGLQQNRFGLVNALSQLEKMREALDDENSEIFESYIGALESLSESIDLEVLALATTEQNDELRVELDRLNGLAQLGITVEILAHELVSYDDMIGMGIRDLPKSVQNSKAVSDIRIGYEGLSNQLQFLSPLQLSGQKIQKWITGKDIFEYVQTFFSTQLSESGVRFDASSDFEKFRVFEQPSRLFPVFINMMNNSIYWVNTKPNKDRRIHFSAIDQKIVISDSGPGVEELDVPKLFSLFFTRKTRGGRGVGLYLARANLSPGGHKIKYATDKADKVLGGANFTINFKGAEYG